MIGFGIYANNKKFDICKLTDDRLIKVDPTTKGFFDNILSVVSEDETIKEVIKAMQEVKEAKLTTFWVPKYLPTIIGNKIMFIKKEDNVITGGRFKALQIKVEEIASVEEKQWRIGTEYQYYAFLVYIINLLVDDGMEIIETIKLFFCYTKKEVDEKGIGKAKNKIYDMIIRRMMLGCSNKKVGGFWIAGEDFFKDSIGDIKYCENIDEVIFNGVPWAILA